MEQYKDYEKIGVAHIFNNSSFQYLKTVRRGSEKDLRGLTNLFDEIGYKTTPHTDLSLSKFNEILDDIAAQSDLSNAGSLIMFFLSHGDGTHIFLNDGRYYIDDIFSKFKGNMCPAMHNKPKVFIFQACRGLKSEVLVESTGTEIDEMAAGQLLSAPEIHVAGSAKALDDLVCEDGVGLKSLPAGSDFLIGNSSCQGYASYRDVNEGSWYIQVLIDVLRQYFEGGLPDHYDITRLLTIVSKQVAEIESWKNIRNDTNLDTVPEDGLLLKQMPAFTSSLTKLFFLPQQPKLTLGGKRPATEIPSNENIMLPQKIKPPIVRFFSKT